MSPTISFIPKRAPGPSSDSAPVREYKKSTDILVAASAIIFFAAVVAASGFYFYERYLNEKLIELSATLSRTEGEFEMPLIEELIRVDKSVASLKSVLASHKSPSRIFDFIEKNTISDVRFLNFAFTEGNAGVSMDGVARGYTALAQQSLVFSDNEFINNIKISNIGLKDDGEVGFRASIIFDPSLIKYQPN